MQKLRNQQKDRPTILCEDEPFENVFRFKYLGTILADQVMDVKARIARDVVNCVISWTQIK